MILTLITRVFKLHFSAAIIYIYIFYYSVWFSWYMKISKEEAVKILVAKQGAREQHRNGAFIVRPSETNPGEISLSVK